MSDPGQSGAGRREVAYRLFATEFDDANLSYSESDEERAPNYVVTPTGARINRLFVVGVLTEVEQVSEDVLRGRVVDPTGAFVMYAGQYQPDEMAFLETADPPMFVAVTGKARTFQPDDSDQVFTSIRPESINKVDANTRDWWTVQAAEQTLDRIARAARALGRDERGDELGAALEQEDLDEGLVAGIPVALDHYGTTPTYLNALRETALDAARVVAGTSDEVSPTDGAPDQPGDARLAHLKTAGVDVAAQTATASDAGPVGGEKQADTAEQTEDDPGQASTGDESQPEAPTATATTDHDTSTTGEGTETSTTAQEDTDSADEVAERGTLDETPSGGAPADTATTAHEEGDSEDIAVEGSIGNQETADESAGLNDPDEGDQTPAGTDELGDFDPGEYELEDETREQIEAEYGTEFQSGTEVDEPGTADIETNDPADAAVATPDEAAEEDTATTDPGGDETANEEAAAEEPDDLQAAVVEVMSDLDDGDGADRDAVIDEMADRYGTDQADTDGAIQDALMDGECYEPDDQTLKPI